MIFTKTGHGGTDKVWFYDMKADGFSLDDNVIQSMKMIYRILFKDSEIEIRRQNENGRNSPSL